MGIFLRSLKLDISFLDNVATAFCPVMADNSAMAVSIIFLSATAIPKPWLMTIFSNFGTCITEVYPNSFVKAGIIRS